MTVNTTGAPVSDDELAALERDGAVKIKDAVPMRWVETLRAGIERGIQEPGPLFGKLSEEGQPGGFFVDTWTRDRITEFNDFVHQSEIASIAAACLNEDRVRLMQDTWFVKRPGTIERTPWHHDNIIQGPFLSIWVALDPIPKDNSLEFVRGSHRWNRYFMPKRYFEREGSTDPLPKSEAYYDLHNQAEANDVTAQPAELRLEPIPDIESERDRYDIVSWGMEPGDCLVFHALTLHGSSGNPSAAEARRFVTRWVGSSAVLAPHGGEIAAGLRSLGFDHQIGPGDPIRGDLFPLLP